MQRTIQMHFGDPGSQLSLRWQAPLDTSDSHQVDCAVCEQEPAPSPAVCCDVSLLCGHQPVLHLWRTLKCCQPAMLEPQSVNALQGCKVLLCASAYIEAALPAVIVQAFSFGIPGPCSAHVQAQQTTNWHRHQGWHRRCCHGLDAYHQHCPQSDCLATCKPELS